MNNIFEDIIENRQNLRQLLIEGLSKIDPDNQIEIDDFESERPTQQFLKKKCREITVTSFVNYQYFGVEYWQLGVWLAEGELKTIEELVLSINLWLNSEIKATELAKQYKDIEATSSALPFEEDREVECKWEWMVNNADSTLLPFIELARKDEVVNPLYPYFSYIHNISTTIRFCVSKTTGAPYTIDTPYVIYNSDSNSYEIYSHSQELLVSGDAEETLKVFKKSLLQI